jgi:hypothetical protein
VFVAPPADQLGELGFDLTLPLRQDPPHTRGDAGQVPGAVRVGLPGDAEAVGELGPEGSVVDPADRALLAHQEPGVERQPPPSRVLHLRRDHRVAVQLGIDRPGRVLAEHRHGQALGVDLMDTVGAPAGDRAVGLQPPERGVDPGVMGGQDLSLHEPVRRQGPQGRDRLRRRERRIEPPGRPITEGTTQASAGAGVLGFEQRTEVLTGHLTVKAERRTTVAPPAAGRFVRVEVVVDRTLRRAPAGPVLGQTGVVADHRADTRPGRLQRRHPHHDDHHSHGPPAGPPAGGRARGRVRGNATVCDFSSMCN